MKNKRKVFFLIGLGGSLILAAALSPFASSSPDGLERVAEEQGFLARAEAPGATAWGHAPVKDYLLPGISNEKLATGAAGLVGTAGTFLLAFGLASLLRRKRNGTP
jgi:cobalt/nickel transport protein